MKATIRIFLQKAQSRRTKNNLCPVKLVITYKKIRRYYSLKDFLKNEWMFLSEDIFNKVLCKTPRGKNKDIATRFNLIIQRGIDIIDKMDIFSFDRFENEFFNKPGNWHNLFYALEDHIENLKREDRIGYASSFNDCYRSVKKFTGGKDVSFTDITPGWLKKYEKWLLAHGKSRATVGIYTRALRVLFNQATQEHEIKAEYPFRKFKPPRSVGNKRALNAKQINEVINYQAVEGSPQQFTRDIFVFSFFANGMNLGDVFRLTHENIQGNEIMFVRQKTRGKQAEVKIRVTLVKTLKDIIDRWGQRAISKGVYIFPVLNEARNEQRKKELIGFAIGAVNRHLKRIAEKINIEKFSSISARHSYATILKNSGASVEYIQEALGHSSVLITQNYLSNFEEDTRKENAEKLETIIKQHGMFSKS